MDLQEASSAAVVTTRDGNKYSVVGSEESGAPKAAPPSSSSSSGAASSSTKQLTVEEVRGSSISELTKSLEFILSQIASQGPTQLQLPIDKDAPLVSLGLDSMTLVQFKGVLENRFHCEDVPDEFLFTPMATLKELAATVRHGTLTPEQRRKFEAGVAAGANNTDPNAQSTTVMMPAARKQPMCPWFTCCY